MTTEWGVRSVYPNGSTQISGGFTRAGAERLVAAAGDGKCWHPVAEAVVCREVGDWVDVRSDEAAT